MADIDTAAARHAGSRGVLTGLIGRGIGSSKSPLIHQAEADQLGLRLVYSMFDFDALGWADGDLPALVSALAMAGFSGVNVTFPFKHAIVPLLDRVTDQVTSIGAVNTVVFDGGKAIGHNTDIIGFAEGLREKVGSDRLDRVVLLGAGGAGSAAAWALLGMGVRELIVVDPDAGRRASLIDALAGHFGPDRIVGIPNAAAISATVSGVVNATPIGMAKLPGTPVDPIILAGRPWVYDIIYFPAETEFLKAAWAAGCLAFNGITMVVHQAAAAFQLFTGTTPDIARMQRTVEA